MRKELIIHKGKVTSVIYTCSLEESATITKALRILSQSGNGDAEKILNGMVGIEVRNG